MKRALSLLMALCMAFSLIACGSDTPAASSGAASSGAASSSATESIDPTYSAENPLVMKFTWPGTLEDSRGQAFQKMADAMYERSGGAIVCELYPGNELGNQNDTIEMIANGANMFQTISADFTADYGCSDMLLCNMFFTFDSLEKTLEFSDSDIFQNMCDQVSAGGLKVLNLAWIEPPRMLMTTKPVQSFADLKGMKIRVPGFVYADFWEGCGAAAVSVGLTDAYSALSTGILDGTETYYESLYNYSIYEVAPYVYETAHTTAPGVILMSQAIWDSLGETLQTIIDEEAYNAGKWFSDQQTGLQAEYRQKLADNGVTFYEVKADDLVLLKQVAADQVASYIEDYNLTPGKYEEIVNFLAD